MSLFHPQRMAVRQSNLHVRVRRSRFQGDFSSSSLPYQNFGVPPLALQGPHQTTHEIALLAVERVCSAVASAVLRLYLAPRKEDFANELILLA